MLKTLQPGKTKPYLTKEQKRAARRVGDLTRRYRDQYPNGLPHNDVGVKYAKYICRTMAFLPDDRRAPWLDRYTPWMDPEIRGSILSLGPHWYAPRSLGNHLEIDDEDRERLELWTIEVWNISKEQREMINLEKNRQSHERRRRKAGAKPREQSLSRTQPWKDDGISRRTWERRRKAGDASSSRPYLNIRQKDEVASNDIETLPTAPSQPSNPAVSAGGVPATQRLEPIAPSQPQAGRRSGSNVASLANYLARKKALATDIRERGAKVRLPMAA
jgi:hypothetical protein